MENLSLYVHIPFCESKCYYCNFNSKKAVDSEKEKYVEYLLKEIERESVNYKNYNVKTIFIGGGTPSCLKSGEILKISEKIYSCFNIDPNLEFTLEANPNSLTFKKCLEYKKAKINRVSVGLQSANNKTLKLLNRIHTKKDFKNAIKNLKKACFLNINADILLSTPNMNKFSLKNTLKFVLKQKLSHLSCYSLILEENTKLYNLVKQNKIKIPSEAKSVKHYDFCVKFLKKYGFNRYEISNFSLENFECQHNLVYWNLGNYLGLGLSSHSKIKNTRFNNPESFNDYYQSLDDNKTTHINRYSLSLNDEKEEYIMLKLRTNKGINLEEYEKLFNENLLLKKQKVIEILRDNKFISINNNHLFLTDAGFKVSNNIILQLI